MVVTKEVKAVGSRAEVWHGNAKHTSGGLTKSQLKKNKHGKIVSKKASTRARTAKNLGSCLVPKGSKKFMPGGKCGGKTTKRKTLKRKTRRTVSITQIARNRALGKGRAGDLTRALKRILM